MNPAEFKSSDIIICWEASQINSSVINIIGFNINTEVYVWVILIVIVRSWNGFKSINISKGLNCIIFPFNPSLISSWLIEIRPIIIKSHCALYKSIWTTYWSCLSISTSINCIIQSFIFIWSDNNWIMSVCLILQ